MSCDDVEEILIGFSVVNSSVWLFALTFHQESNMEGGRNGITAGSATKRQLFPMNDFTICGPWLHPTILGYCNSNFPISLILFHFIHSVSFWNKNGYKLILQKKSHNNKIINTIESNQVPVNDKIASTPKSGATIWKKEFWGWNPQLEILIRIYIASEQVSRLCHGAKFHPSAGHPNGSGERGAQSCGIAAGVASTANALEHDRINVRSRHLHHRPAHRGRCIALPRPTRP